MVSVSDVSRITLCQRMLPTMRHVFTHKFIQHLQPNSFPSTPCSNVLTGIFGIFYTVGLSNIKTISDKADQHYLPLIEIYSFLLISCFNVQIYCLTCIHVQSTNVPNLAHAAHDGLPCLRVSVSDHGVSRINQTYVAVWYL